MVEERGVVTAVVWVVCQYCGIKHRVLPGIGAPIYWCGNTLHCMMAGDDVEYEEILGEDEFIGA